MRIKKCLLALFVALTTATSSYANERILNIYAWTGEIPSFVIKMFEQETGIHVNFSTYENNEIMYTKLRTTTNAGYDIVMPSSYFVDRMRRQGMLMPLDRKKIPNWKNLNTSFLNLPFDPESKYCVPYVWGTTGIFVNKHFYSENSVQRWSDLWDSRFKDKLMLLDDTREVFAIALLTLGYSPNDRNPEHIKEAFIKLKSLIKNVKVFSSETVVSIMVDEDANIGMAWNGDALKAMEDNKNIRYVYPQDGFVIWVDSFSIPMHSQHVDEAYTFINFMLRPDIAKLISIRINFPTANSAGQTLLPSELRDNPTFYPSKEILKRGVFQKDVGDETLALYEKYWEELKMNG